MHSRFQVAAGSDLEKFADVDHQRPVDRRCVDPIAVVLDLQTALARFDIEQCQYTRVLVPADALGAGTFRAARVTHHLDEDRRIVSERVVEDVRILAQGYRPFA
ncbi:hypothetical protein N806_18810 [Rhodococcus sp. P27]|nr:hypothetical protein N806_18810 [Rhodococcus sp. P27]